MNNRSSMNKPLNDEAGSIQLPRQTQSRYILGEVYSIRQLTPSIKEYTIKLEEEINPNPGQFAMLWIPDIGEIPLSFADYSTGTVKFIICRVGFVTTYIHRNILVGSRVFLRGPLGNGFTLCSLKNCLLIGGGYGLAPLYYLGRILAMNNCRLKTLLGFKNSSDVFYVSEFSEISDTYISTEDGEEGFKGTVVDMVRKILAEETFDIVYVCGREQMLMKVVKECSAKGMKTEASLERIIKCGVGLCGSCSVEPLGLRVCRDGPVFDGRLLLKLEDPLKNNREEICIKN
ncbi:MAG: dihydroorotate dehydrogenase electron transfer subunit [Thaumarchaeota archaeon]|nr:dihydroorotate dehydrogenase electron transfer subunit [Candidatus Geocrenenecus arthurdayi]